MSRPALVRIACLLLAVGVSVISMGSVWQRTDGDDDSQAVSDRQFQITYTARIPSWPEATAEVDVWVPLATTRDGQEILRRTIHVDYPHSIHRESTYGNDVLHLRLTAPLPEPLEITVDYEAVVHGRRVLRTAFNASEVPAPHPRYLEPDALVPLNASIQQLSHEATAGRTGSWDRARGIYDFVIQFMRYDKTVAGWGRGDAPRACLLAAGNCTDFHSLFIGMARAAGIPARFKIGFTVPQENAGSIAGYHCWAEFHNETSGWVPVDASEAWKATEQAEYYFGTVDPNKFLVSIGRDLQLVPAQRGGPVNIWFYPYVEVNGEVFNNVESEFRFQVVPDITEENVT
jgi:transglutaminase-like putative cysteine protease